MYRRPRKIVKTDQPNRLSEWRIARGLSQEALAAQMGSSKQTVHRHENSTDVSLAALIRYAKVLDVHVEELLIDSLRVPKAVARLVETAEKLAPKQQILLLQIGETMERAAVGFGEDDEPFTGTS